MYNLLRDHPRTYKVELRPLTRINQTDDPRYDVINGYGFNVYPQIKKKKKK